MKNRAATRAAALLLALLISVVSLGVGTSAADFKITLVPVRCDGNTAVFDVMVYNHPGITQLTLSMTASWVDGSKANAIANTFSGTAGTMFEEVDFGYPTSGMNLSGGDAYGSSGTHFATVTVNLSGAPEDGTVSLIFRECYDGDISPIAPSGVTGGDVLCIASVFSGDVREPVTIRFSANGGEGTMKEMESSSGTIVKLPANAFTRSGYTFAGWATEPWGSPVYPDQSSIAAAEMTLYPVWQKADDFRILLVPVSNDGNKAVFDIVLENNPGICLVYLSLQPSWMEDVAEKEKAALVAAQFKGTNGGIFTETDFGYVGSGMNILSGGYENSTEDGVLATVTVTLADVPDDGKLSLMFLECYGGIIYVDDHEVYPDGHPFHSLIASLPVVSLHNVSYNANGGKGTVPTQTIARGAAAEVSANAFTRSGYTFAGWALDSAAAEPDFVAGDLIAPTENLTLYAVWKCSHNYVAVVTPPTATEKGYTTHTCSRCGDSYVDSYTDPVAPATLWGDVNGDGSVNTKDLTLLRSYLANLNPETNVSLVTVQAGADCNGDGTVNTKDLTLLRAYLANFDPETGLSAVVLGPQK